MPEPEQRGELPDRAEIEVALRELPVSRASMEQVIAEMRPSARLLRHLGGPSVPEGAKDWILLLQVDTDDDSDGPGWMWGDCGRIYFWIRRQDLAARRFDRAWTVLQCT